MEGKGMGLSRWEGASGSADEAIASIRSGDHVFVHGAAATPTPLLEAMCRRQDLTDIQLYHLHTSGPTPFADAAMATRFRSNSFFCGEALRPLVAEGLADFIPVFLSDIPHLFTSGKIRLGIALLQLSPPDRHGLCSLGTSCDAARAAADHARIVIAEINEQMPCTSGHTVFPFSRVHGFVKTNRPLWVHQPAPETDVEARIGELIANLVEHGSTLQMGIGGIPDAALLRLRDKLDLGVHTEMFSDRVVDLAESGALTNRRKNVYPGRTITSFVWGTERVYRYVDQNPLVEFHPCDHTNDTSVIRRNENVVAINSALQIDLTGQVCADSIGHRIYSGIGGQLDFMRGAALSNGGKPIIALPATACHGTVSRIAPELNPGAGVVTTRGHVHWVVTEFGAVNLHGEPLRKRGELLISIAHPDFRSELRDKLHQLKRI